MLDISQSSIGFTLAQRLIFSVPSKYSDSGTSKVGTDLASRIANAIGITPRIILSEQITETLRENPQAFLVSIGLDEVKLRKYKDDKRIFKVGYSDYFSHYLTADLHNIFLNPQFHLFASMASEKAQAKGVEVIDYTYLPSRIAPRKLDGRKKPPETFVVYYRAQDKDNLYQKFIDDTATLHEQSGYNFFVTTGYSTTDPIADALEGHFNKLCGSRFCRYDSTRINECMKFYERAYAEADAAIVTDDTASGLSDAANSLLPTYLLKTIRNAQWLWQKSGKIHPLDQANIEHKLQLDLFRQGRLKVFSRTAVIKPWQPTCVDEWAGICSHIAEKLYQYYSAQLIT